MPESKNVINDTDIIQIVPSVSGADDESKKSKVAPSPASFEANTCSVSFYKRYKVGLFRVWILVTFLWACFVGYKRYDDIKGSLEKFVGRFQDTEA